MTWKTEKAESISIYFLLHLKKYKPLHSWGWNGNRKGFKLLNPTWVLGKKKNNKEAQFPSLIFFLFCSSEFLISYEWDGKEKAKVLVKLSVCCRSASMPSAAVQPRRGLKVITALGLLTQTWCNLGPFTCSLISWRAVSREGRERALNCSFSCCISISHQMKGKQKHGNMDQPQGLLFPQTYSSQLRDGLAEAEGESWVRLLLLGGLYQPHSPPFWAVLRRIWWACFCLYLDFKENMLISAPKSC